MDTKIHSVELTDEEITLIKNSLDFYGVRMAETVGYSAGEVYWDLMNEIDKQTRKKYVRAKRIKKAEAAS